MEYGSHTLARYWPGRMRENVVLVLLMYEAFPAWRNFASESEALETTQLGAG
jgi:hypothetical protein